MFCLKSFLTYVLHFNSHSHCNKIDFQVNFKEPNMHISFIFISTTDFLASK